MAKKYVPEGAWLSCDKGLCPSQLRVTHNENTTIYSQPMATEADLWPMFNIKSMGTYFAPKDCTVRHTLYAYGHKMG